MTTEHLGFAVSLTDVCKSFNLYSSPVLLASDQLGFFKIPFIRRPKIPRLLALSQISLRVAPGERIGIVGRNGSGKTTLLRIISGSLRADAGRVEVNGTVRALMSVGGGFHPDLSGRMNIEASLSMLGLVGAPLCEAMTNVIEFSELGEHLDQPFSTYSLGMQARTQFAVNTVTAPQILIVDEILGAGDGYFAIKSAHRMDRLLERGCALLFVSHSAEQVLRYCSRAIWLEAGTIIRDGPAADVIAAFQSELTQSTSSRTVHRALDPARGFELPDDLKTEFVGKAILKAEPTSAQEVVLTLHDGSVAHSRPGRPGPRICAVSLQASPARSRGCKVGDRLSLECQIVSNESARFALRPRLLFFSISGERVAVSSDKVIEKDLDQGRPETIRLTIDACRLGSHRYVCSLLLEDAGCEPFCEESRYDLWSRFASIRFELTNDTDPPLLHIAGLWHFPGGDCQPARMEGRV